MEMVYVLMVVVIAWLYIVTKAEELHTWKGWNLLWWIHLHQPYFKGEGKKQKQKKAHLALKRSVATQVTLKHIRLSERSQTQKAAYCTMPFIRAVGGREWISHPSHPHTCTYSPHLHHTPSSRKKFSFPKSWLQALRKKLAGDFITAFQCREWDYCSRAESVLDVLIQASQKELLREPPTVNIQPVPPLPKLN